MIKSCLNSGYVAPTKHMLIRGPTPDLVEMNLIIVMDRSTVVHAAC